MQKELDELRQHYTEVEKSNRKLKRKIKKAKKRTKSTAAAPRAVMRRLTKRLEGDTDVMKLVERHKARQQGANGNDGDVSELSTADESTMSMSESDATLADDLESDSEDDDDDDGDGGDSDEEDGGDKAKKRTSAPVPALSGAQVESIRCVFALLREGEGEGEVKVALHAVVSALQGGEGRMAFSGGQFTLNDLFGEMDEALASSQMACEEFITFTESRMKYYLARAAGAERREQHRRRTLRKADAAAAAAASLITSSADSKEIMEILVGLSNDLWDQRFV